MQMLNMLLLQYCANPVQGVWADYIHTPTVVTVCKRGHGLSITMAQQCLTMTT